ATLKELISQTMVRWSQEDQIQDPELVRIMYSLLRRQYDSIGELLQALRKAYTISAASVKDTINLLAALGQIRSLLSVRMGKEEELLMINGLGYGINGILSLSCISNSLSPAKLLSTLCPVINKKLNGIGINPWDTTLVTGTQVCIHVYFLNKCLKTINSVGNYILFPQRALNNFLALYCEKQVFYINPYFLLQPFGGNMSYEQIITSVLQVVTYLAGCGLQSCPVLLAKGYPDIGWNPIEGERYLSFLRFAVFANSESVEENASVVVKLLIR
ncbi:RYR3 protein, partial [Rhodinocichla rosea]|nr:RYR3 protein [Rhodinocichla rosea]